MKEWDKNDYEPGKWNVICDRCGFKFKNNKLRPEYTGLMVCSGQDTNDCWEPRPVPPHRSRIDRPRIPYVAIMQDEFIPGPACAFWSVRAYPGLAVVGCVIAGLDDFPPDVLIAMRDGT